MKPAPFEYSDPHDVDEALALLAEVGDEGKLLAGGQSLVPMLNFRLAQPGHLIDLNRIPSLAYVRRREGSLHIGAMTRHAALERSPVAAEGWPLLREALHHVAHAQIRNRGTVGGSVAHADPAAELPVAFAALDARFHVRSKRAGTRTIVADDFFITHLTTSMEPDELLVEIEVPALPAATGHSFREFSRRHGDFALGGAAVLVTAGEDGVCSQAAISLLGAADTPVRARAAEAALAGRAVDQAAAREAASLAVADIDPTGDIHGSGPYRKRLIEHLVRQAVIEAAGRARDGQA
jgi:carbon-monoxide dehydrogenase medium subunit/6-hydroxypseudooxynicotine dehydrogenase subunit alpha